MKFQWKDVRGSKGYIVRLKKENGVIIEETTSTNSIELGLEPGDYSIQVAGKNAFGKPGRFSGWKDFSIQKNQKAGSFDLSSNKPPEYEMDISNQISFSHWERLTPGYIQYKKGKWLEPILYWTVMPVLGYVGVSEKIRGDRIATDPWNDPVILYFSLNERSSFEKLYFQQRRLNEKKKYNQSQEMQKLVGAGILISYIIHLMDAYLFDGAGILGADSRTMEDPTQINTAWGERVIRIQMNFSVDF